MTPQNKCILRACAHKVGNSPHWIDTFVRCRVPKWLRSWSCFHKIGNYCIFFVYTNINVYLDLNDNQGAPRVCQVLVMPHMKYSGKFKMHDRLQLLELEESPCMCNYLKLCLLFENLFLIFFSFFFSLSSLLPPPRFLIFRVIVPEKS